MDSYINEVGKLAVGGEGDIKGRMKRWEPTRFGTEINCNRFDLWEDFEKGTTTVIKKAKKIKPSKLGIFGAVIALGAVATTFAAKNIFSAEA